MRARTGVRAIAREPACRLHDNSVDLKRKTAEVSIRLPLLRDFSFTRRQPAGTPPSTFLFLPIHFSNSPGTMAAPPSGEPESRRSRKPPTFIGSLITENISEMLRRRAIAPLRRAARRTDIYSGGPRLLSTREATCRPINPAHKGWVSFPQRRVDRAIRKSRVVVMAALEPHS